MTEDTTNKTRKAEGVHKSGPPALTIDWDLYGAYLENSDLSEAQQRDFIETLWSIVVSFVDLGFGIHPIQQALEQPPTQNTASPCGLNGELNSLITQEASYMVGWESATGQTETGTALATAERYHGTTAKGQSHTSEGSTHDS